MPSLRRTLSSPSVRSSPYPATLSHSTRAHGHVPRRSSGSDTSNRRVLADIDWWRVTDGQRDAEAEQESDERDQNQVQDVEAHVGGISSPISEFTVSPSTPLTWAFESFSGSNTPEPFPSPPISQLAVLSITPSTPSRHSLVSSTSSLESTPEATEIPLECLGLGGTDMDTAFSDTVSQSIQTPNYPGTLHHPDSTTVPHDLHSFIQLLLA